MSRHRVRPPSIKDEESSSDDDGFGVFASSAKKSDRKKRSNPSTCQLQQPPKRHYGASSTRKTKMETVLEELQMEKQPSLEHRRPPNRSSSTLTGGSFVDPEHEYSTTNMFVGNLPLTINESILSDFFVRFGENLFLLLL